MKRLMCMALLLSPLCIGPCVAQSATFVYKNGKVEFGDLKKMTPDSVYMETADKAGTVKNTAIAKNTLSEVVFDSGDRLNLALAHYPPVTASSSAAAPEVSKSTPERATARVVAVSSSPSPSESAPPWTTPVRNPFTYGGFSAIIPGLGQAMQGEYSKGAICFGIVGLSAVGAMVAWNSTTDAYHTLQQNQLPNGQYNNSDYQRFTFRLHGAEILTFVTAALYLLNIADATADAFIFNKQYMSSSVKPSLTVSPNGASCGLAINF